MINSLLLLGVAINLASAAQGNSNYDLTYTYQFAASGESFAFARESGDLARDLVVYNVSDGKVTIYRSQSQKLWYLSPRPAKQGGFFASYWKQITPDQFRSGRVPVMRLYRCANGECVTVFDFAGAIESPIDLGGGETLFVGSMPTVFQRSFSPEFVGFARFDFYSRSGTGQIQRVTDWDAAQLNAVSLGGNRLLFDFISTPGRPTPQPRYPVTKSSIWAATLTHDSGRLRIAFEGDRPFIQYGKDNDIEASISPDGTKTAFYSTSKHAGNERRYDIVVFDNNLKRELVTIAPEENTKFSFPVFVADNLVRFMAFDGLQYTFRQINLSDKRGESLGQVTLNDLAKAEIVDVKDQEGDR